MSQNGCFQNAQVNVIGPACAEVRKAAAKFVSFLNKAVTPFHAVEECSRMLREAGFRELNESDTWKVEPNQKYFVTKNRSAILAFAVGGSYKSGNGFSIIVGHTDSPCLRVKPVSTLKSEKFLQVGVSTYGGGRWCTWFDRDLCLAGQVVIRQKNSIVRKLINIAKPILFIPNLAIHLETDRTKFECNNETHLRPLIASYAAVQLNKCDDKQCEIDETDPRTVVKDHHNIILELIAKDANCQPTEILDMDLYLYDSQPAAVTGIKEEFISGARLDNLIGTYTSMCGLIASLQNESSFEADSNIRIAACYDNEEVGSKSSQGAESAFTEWVLRRLSSATAGRSSQTAFEEAIGKSYLISADQAHACHPNYPQKHEENHRPAFHRGVIVKINNNQHYATTSLTHAVLKQLAHIAQVPLQKVVVRNDFPCGSTIGPILSSGLGLQAVDVGCPSLAMHSIREFGDTTGIFYATKLYTTFYEQLPTVLASLQ